MDQDDLIPVRERLQEGPKGSYSAVDERLSRKVFHIVSNDTELGDTCEEETLQGTKPCL